MRKTNSIKVVAVGTSVQHNSSKESRALRYVELAQQQMNGQEEIQARRYHNNRLRMTISTLQEIAHEDPDNARSRDILTCEAKIAQNDADIAQYNAALRSIKYEMRSLMFSM